MKILLCLTSVICALESQNVMGNNAAAVPISYAQMPNAYIQISQQYGIPSEVFFSVMMQESSSKINIKSRNIWVPWPWTLNVELKPYYFSNKQEAKTALRQFLATDNKRIAVGIGQIYLPSHGHLFNDPTVLLEPEINLHYAAKLLADNFQWTIDRGNPNWWTAVGRYHTPSRPDLAIPYSENVYARCKRISPHCDRFGSVSKGIH